MLIGAAQLDLDARVAADLVQAYTALPAKALCTLPSSWDLRPRRRHWADAGTTRRVKAMQRGR